MSEKTAKDVARDFEKEANDFARIQSLNSRDEKFERITRMINYLDTLENMIEEKGVADRMNKTCDAIEKELNIK